VAKAFASLPTVYDALGVPVNTVQTDAGIFGAREARMPRRLGKTSLSQYIDCGIHASGAPNADTYSVTMTVLSRVTAAASGGSTVATQVMASGAPDHRRRQRRPVLEQRRLENAINKRLAEEAAR
jgi:hypothetical protein